MAPTENSARAMWARKSPPTIQASLMPGKLGMVTVKPSMCPAAAAARAWADGAAATITPSTPPQSFGEVCASEAGGLGGGHTAAQHVHHRGAHLIEPVVVVGPVAGCPRRSGRVLAVGVVMAALGRHSPGMDRAARALRTGPFGPGAGTDRAARRSRGLALEALAHQRPGLGDPGLGVEDLDLGGAQRDGPPLDLLGRGGGPTARPSRSIGAAGRLRRKRAEIRASRSSASALQGSRRGETCGPV